MAWTVEQIQAAQAAELAAIHSAFCMAVAETHPAPLKLLSAFNSNLKMSNAAITAETPEEVKQANRTANEFADALKKVLTGRG